MYKNKNNILNYDEFIKFMTVYDFDEYYTINNYDYMFHHYANLKNDKYNSLLDFNQFLYFFNENNHLFTEQKILQYLKIDNIDDGMKKFKEKNEKFNNLRDISETLKYNDKVYYKIYIENIESRFNNYPENGISKLTLMLQ